MSIKSRLPKIKDASRNVVEVLRASVTRKIYGLRGSDPASNYEIEVKFVGRDKLEDVEFITISCQCQKVTGTGMEDCRGNSNGTICYHSLAVLENSSEKKGKQLIFFDNFSDAFLYKNFGGKLVKIASSQGKGQAWGVLK